MEHLLGKGIDRVIQGLNNRRIKKWGAGAAPFHTRGHLKRFSVLASMISARELRVVDIKGDVRPAPYRPVIKKMSHPALLPEHGFGWSDGETLFLPVSIVDMPSCKEQQELAKLLVFFLSAQIKWGSLRQDSSNRTILERDRPLADIYWILENVRLSCLLHNNFPGIFRSWRAITEHLSGRRPRADQINRAEQRMEEFLKESLASAPSASPPTTAPLESLHLAGKIRERWLGEGITFKRYRGMVPFTPWGRLIPGRIKSGLDPDTVPGARKDPERARDLRGPGKAETDTRNKYMARKERVDEKENEQGLMLNIYDKILSWAQFVNVRRPFDDEPEKENEKKADEMEELTIAEVRRSTSSFLDADLEKGEDFSEEPMEGESGSGKVYIYPEWDYRKQGYLQGFSTVKETETCGSNKDFFCSVLVRKRGLVKEVRRKFEALTPASKLVKRQLEGDSIDIDALVESIADLAARRQPDERLYTAYKRTERDLSALFLVDLSMSTDSWVGDRRIIDHEKEALIILCEALEKLRDRYAIYGFSGRTRKDCRFFHIKGFAEAYTEKIKGRIGGLISYHYTRMGPAVRHATHILESESSRARLLFLISDGKPNDVDIYEGRYGIDDTRMAIKEAQSEGIIPFCLTVDSRAHEYLPRLFGSGNYAVVSGADRLTKTLPELYARIIQKL